jgi:hypothetical protein
MTAQSKSLQEIIAGIEALDLTPIKFKATRKEDGYGWSAERANQIEIAYKRYLILHAKYPEMTLAPDQDVDRLWHMHILDTRKYAADCEAIFGRFLHHFPYLGLRGEDDARALEEAFRKQQELYAKEFGEPVQALHHDAAWCSLDASPKGAAWCSLESKQASAAWCSAESPKTSAAWCSAESPKASAAWCSAESPKASAAWCSAESPKASAAWCSAESPKASAAWCSAESPKASAAWCSAESPKTTAAWCSAESPKASAAWCSAESPQASAAWCSAESPKASAA